MKAVTNRYRPPRTRFKLEALQRGKSRSAAPRQARGGRGQHHFPRGR